jgi:3-hydroxyacyl-[acyl-carrier-protein] dehydratase
MAPPLDERTQIMRWRFLERITELVPGKRAVALATTSFPEALYADHFPTVPVTPGVLLLEFCVQLASMLAQATSWETRGVWVLPVLIIIYEGKFRSFVPPATRVLIETSLEELHPKSGVFNARVMLGDQRCLSARFVLSLDPYSHALPRQSRQALESFGREEFDRVESPWRPGSPPAAAAVAGSVPDPDEGPAHAFLSEQRPWGSKTE